MQTLRRDPLSGTWVILATERARRPVGPPSEAEHTCPFCSGNEQLTPPELASWNDAQGRWAVRVVNNLFPALSPLPSEEVDCAHPSGSSLLLIDRLYTDIPATGAHEVIVEHPRHDMTWDTMPLAHLTSVLEAWQDRYRHHAAQPGVQYVQLFKNHGLAAGASLRHPHSQLVALPLVPLFVEREVEWVREYFSATGRCPICETIVREREEGRQVAQTTISWPIVPSPLASPTKPGWYRIATGPRLERSLPRNWPPWQKSCNRWPRPSRGRWGMRRSTLSFAWHPATATLTPSTTGTWSGCPEEAQPEVSNGVRDGSLIPWSRSKRQPASASHEVALHLLQRVRRTAKDQ